MSDEKQIQIKLSKRKLTLALIGSALFIAFGICLVINPSKFINPIVQNTSIIFSAGVASILFLGFFGYFILKKLGDKKPGLIITEKGIIDNSSAVAAGQIFWSDVSIIRVVEAYKQKFIMLIVHNPDQYIRKQTGLITRKAMQMKFKMYGSPISISASDLQCNLYELKNILDEKFAEFKTQKQAV